MKICKRCIQPDTRPGIYFNDDGICGSCVWEDEKKKIDWDSRFNELKDIANYAKNTTQSNYDCVIGVSGGKDSTTQAVIAREELGLHCLLVNGEPEGLTELGRHNIENLKQLGFDVISMRPNPKLMKKLIKWDFYNHLNPVKATEFSLWASTYIIAEKFRVPLIIQGENPGLTLGARLTGVGTDGNALKAEMLQTLSKGFEEYLSIDGVTENDLYFFHYDRKKLESNNTKGIWLNYYIKEWSNRHSAEIAEKYGFKMREKNFNPESIGTYVRYFQLDTDLTQVNQLLKFIKFGFGQCMDHVCYDIVDQKMTRNEGIELVKKYDGKCSSEYIKNFCNYIEISEEEFWNVAEKFRGNMWKKVDNQWKNMIWDLF